MLMALRSLAAVAGASTSASATAMYIVGLVYACVHAFGTLPAHWRRRLCVAWTGARYERVITSSACASDSEEERRDCNARLVNALSDLFDSCDPGWNERCTRGVISMTAFGIRDYPEHWTGVDVRLDDHQRTTVYVSVAVGQDSSITMRLQVRAAHGGAFIARMCHAAEQAYERKLRARHRRRHLYIPQASAYCNSMGMREILVQRVPLSQRMPLEALCHPEVPRIRRALRSFAAKSYDGDHGASLPNKLGVFAYGVPGSGKTTLARAIANELDRDILLVDLNVIKNPTELGYLFGNGVFRVANTSSNTVEYVSIEYDKVVILLDDMDCSADVADVSGGEGPSNVAAEESRNEPRLSLKNVLHEMDGIKETPGRVVVATAFAVDGIDDAMRRRGRFDMMLKFDYATVDMAMRKIGFVFGKRLSAEQIRGIRPAVEAWLHRDNKRTLADVESICKEVLGDVAHLASAFDRDL